jgi:uncharacterized membrane protein
MLIVFPLGLLGMAWMRWNAPQMPSNAAMLLSFTGLVLALVTGWLGGELVDRLGVGLDEGAHVARPSAWLHGRAGTST